MNQKSTAKLLQWYKMVLTDIMVILMYYDSFWEVKPSTLTWVLFIFLLIYSSLLSFIYSTESFTGMYVS